jgi:hypothetical protein
MLSFWRCRQAAALPLLMWGPVAMVQEGVTFSLGLLTSGGDGQWIIQWGVPQAVLLSVGLLSLAGGIVLITKVLQVTDINQQDSLLVIFLILFVGLSTLMVIRGIVSAQVSTMAALENFIPLMFSIILTILITFLYKPLLKVWKEKREIQADVVQWSASLLAIGSGLGLFLIQVILP